MTDLSKLYQIAAQENIEIDCFELRNREALSLMDEDGLCYIAIDPYRLRSTNDERVKLAHELGHCTTGSFYNIYATTDQRQRHENRADKWAITQLIPMEDLDEAISDSCTQIWELAERFGVTEDFMKKAICYYANGNVAWELYL